MKIRKGFVSNSSSSSFICDITGTVESGYDASPSDFGMVTCEIGHTFMERFILSGTDVATGDNFNDDDEVLSEYCPICKMAHIRDTQLITYLLHTLGKTRAEVTKEIASTFNTLSDFTNYIKRLESTLK